MVVRMMKWRPWPPNFSKKFQVNLSVHCLESFPAMAETSGELEGLMVDVKWKGSKGGLGSRFRRSLKRGRTTEKVPGESGIVSWEEEFEHVCALYMAKNSLFQPWDVHFVILQAVHHGTKTKLSVAGTGIMNLADFASPAEESRRTTRIKVSCSVGADTEASLLVTVKFVELRTSVEGIESLHRIIAPSLPCIGGPLFQDKSELHSEEETGIRKAKNAKRSEMLVNGKKNSGELGLLDGGKLYPTSDENSHDSGYFFDSDSVEDYVNEEVKQGEDHSFRKSMSYGTLAGVNLVVEGALPHYRGSADGQNSTQSIISIHSRSAVEAIPKSTEETSASDSDLSAPQPTMRSLLSWKKRKLSFRSPRARGEPLLNKSYGDEGGDDIDHDRRQSGSPIEPLPTLRRKNNDCVSPLNISGCLDFGEDRFIVGTWEKKELTSRDGKMKLSASVFFASIDQRSERAAGESACTALVAVIADWLHQNPNRMPIRAEFDTLIREGSAEWRKLCEIDAYRDRFPDRHFDLDTVLQAKVRPLLVDPERSFVGFFQPEGVGDSCDFLQGAMSFENIWDAIWEEVVSVKPEESFEPAIYIVSWNDHFFVLKVAREAYYIIDTLGERLYEGCDQAYILRFDKEASICQVPKAHNAENEKTAEPGVSGLCSDKATPSAASSNSLPVPACHNTLKLGNADMQSDQAAGSEEKNCDVSKLDTAEEKIVYEGKEACKQFVKGFFAALPLRELQIDIKKGLMGKIPLHQRLQIEFHLTTFGVTQSTAADLIPL